MESKIEKTNVTALDSIINDAVRKALRHFAGRIAHDFNNLLTVQLAYPELIKADLEEGCKGHKLLNVIADNAEIMTSIATRLADFALPSNYAKHPISIDDVVLEVLTEFKGSDQAFGITIQHDLTSDCKALIPFDVLRRILKELCINSCESLNGGGNLTVTAKPMNVNERLIANNTVVPLGDYACITVQDSGNGISSDIRAMALEPFFTANKQTKARGAGLGLSIAFATVRDCGGYLLFEDHDGDGCSVSVIIPVVASDYKAEAAAVADEDPSAPRVLVVDDEVAITKLFKIMLMSSIDNIYVDVANNGAEAVRLFEKNHHDVVVMDLNMPGMDGQEAFDRFLQFCTKNNVAMPKVLFCTGYIPTEGVSEAISSDAGHGLLQKPITIKKLINGVKERLPS